MAVLDQPGCYKYIYKKMVEPNVEPETCDSEDESEIDVLKQILNSQIDEDADPLPEYINELPTILSPVNCGNDIDETIEHLQYINNPVNFGRVESKKKNITETFVELALLFGKKNLIHESGCINYSEILQTFYNEDTGPDALYNACCGIRQICSTLMKNPAVAHYDLFSDSLVRNYSEEKLPSPSFQKIAVHHLSQEVPRDLHCHSGNNRGSVKRKIVQKQRPDRFLKKNFHSKPL